MTCFIQTQHFQNLSSYCLLTPLLSPSDTKWDVCMYVCSCRAIVVHQAWTCDIGLAWTVNTTTCAQHLICDNTQRISMHRSACTANKFAGSMLVDNEINVTREQRTFWCCLLHKQCNTTNILTFRSFGQLCAGKKQAKVR